MKVNSTVPEIRLTCLNRETVNPQGDYVLYWMNSSHRLHWNFALDRALDLCRELEKPLLVLELLRCDYRWASERIHAFLLQGMADVREGLSSAGVKHYLFIERSPGEGEGLVEQLARQSCLVVTDDYPSFFFPDWISSSLHEIPVRAEKVDSNGLLPMRAAEKVYPTAYAFRRFLQTQLPTHLRHFPKASPLSGLTFPSKAPVADEVLRRWPCFAGALDSSAIGTLLAELPIDRSVIPAPVEGGQGMAEARLKAFLAGDLRRYGERRNDPEAEGTSGLSPYLHFGHISVHQVFFETMKQESWSPLRLTAQSKGQREGWWGVGPGSEHFLDELVTWREVGFNMAWQRPDYTEFESLPGWARRTLEEHAADPRSHIYSLGQFERGLTHDPLWNSAQTQLVREGRIHNYLRMLWGKKILEWTEHPRQALDVMIELNNKYALDGRDPNSYTGIFWVLGRYDRPWAPERPVFGMIRYMSSENTARKYKVSGYIRKYSQETPLF